MANCFAHRWVLHTRAMHPQLADRMFHDLKTSTTNEGWSPSSICYAGPPTFQGEIPGDIHIHFFTKWSYEDLGDEDSPTNAYRPLLHRFLKRFPGVAVTAWMDGEEVSDRMPDEKDRWTRGVATLYCTPEKGVMDDHGDPLYPTGDES